MSCPQCGHENPADARFCSNCGAALAAEAERPREERKVVTVLFADLVGFTSRAAQMDPEDVTYFLGRETIIVTRSDGMATWREKLFVLMARNAVRATAFFRLPPERVVELGVQVEM